MTNQFVCPKCRSYLNVGDDVILAAKTPEGQRGLIFLHSEPGNYKIRHNPNFDVPSGKKFEFYCPACNAHLASDINTNLSKIMMIDPDEGEYEVHFSKIAGERSTYCLIGENVSIYGEDSGNYVDFINLSQVK